MAPIDLQASCVSAGGTITLSDNESDMRAKSISETQKDLEGVESTVSFSVFREQCPTPP